MQWVRDGPVQFPIQFQDFRRMARFFQSHYTQKKRCDHLPHDCRHLRYAKKSVNQIFTLNHLEVNQNG